MFVEGIVRNGMVVTDQPLPLPEGTRVRIEVADSAQPHGTAARRGGWWSGQVRIAADFDELPSDIARAFGMDDE